ncbi:hypothetical protein vBSlqSZDD2_35 [Serratia phage vB_SlqS_ZDD2]|nr:hypothetical protein vBSlqSZDD2_35 [Serratia phage vB_SlqS_ZDD2]
METRIIVVDSCTGEVVKDHVERQESASKPKRQGHKPAPKMKLITCAAPGCKNQKEVRVVDWNRGWGRYCSKSCAKK